MADRPGAHKPHDHPETDHECPGCRVCDCYRDEQTGVDGDHVDHDHGALVDHSGHEAMFKRRFIVTTILAIPVLYLSPTLQNWLGYTAVQFPGSDLVGPLLAVVVFGYGGVPFLRMGLIEARNREPGMMLLISLAITVAFVYSLAAVTFDIGEPFFWELVTLIVIFLLGHWIEMRSVRRASGALDELAELLPTTAERLSDSDEPETVPVDELREDDLVLVRPGSNVPADGVVVEGESNVNESMLTGESKPVAKEPGDTVIGGTTNREGSLRVRVTATGEDTTLSGIVRLVREAQQSKSRTQVLADRAAGWLFYAAIGVGVFTALAWTVAIGFGLPVVERVVTVLVIACPHALGLAVPLVVAINTTMAANNGMLIRDRLAMEEARGLDTIVFDKTGTLTKGEQGVVDIESVEGWSAEAVLGIMAGAEADSEHMIAQAIRAEARERSVPIPTVREFTALEGRGVKAVLEDGHNPTHEARQLTQGTTIHIGGPNLLRHLGVSLPTPLARFAERSGEKGQGVVHLIIEDEVIGSVALADVIRPESHEAITQLQEMGIEVAMLTGDSEDVARAVAGELGIETVFAEVLPEDKDSTITELQSQGDLVAMVGDGVNDAPALTRADVGIAIGSGTDIAVESADVILVESDPRDVVNLVTLSRTSYRKMQENLVWAAGYNVFALPLAAGILAPIGVLLTPAIGAILMSASTVIVAINAQLLRRADIDWA